MISPKTKRKVDREGLMLYDGQINFSVRTKSSKDLEVSYCNGILMEEFVKSAFNKEDPNNKSSIDAIKQMLWHCFRECIKESKLNVLQK